MRNLLFKCAAVSVMFLAGLALTWIVAFAFYKVIPSDFIFDYDAVTVMGAPNDPGISGVPHEDASRGMVMIPQGHKIPNYSTFWISRDEAHMRYYDRAVCRDPSTGEVKRKHMVQDQRTFENAIFTGYNSKISPIDSVPDSAFRPRGEWAYSFLTSSIPEVGQICWIQADPAYSPGYGLPQVRLDHGPILSNEFVVVPNPDFKRRDLSNVAK